jgi:hypothetical protein
MGQSIVRTTDGYSTEQRTLDVIFAPQGAGGKFYAGWKIGDGHGGAFGTVASVDGAANLLTIHAPSTTFASAPAAVATVAISALVVGREYRLRLSRDQRINTATLYDLVTGSTIATVSNGNNISASTNGTSGECDDSPTIFNYAGQHLFKRVTASARPHAAHAIIYGDSITAGHVVGLTDRWGQMLRDALGGMVALGGVSNATSAMLPRRIAGELAAFVACGRLKWVIVYLGTNDQDSSLASFSTNVDALRTYCNANDLRLAVGVIAPGDGRAVTNLNSYLLGLTDVRHIRFDRALSINNDGITKDATKYAEAVHPNALGNLAMYQRVLIDVPELFS